MPPAGALEHDELGLAQRLSPSEALLQAGFGRLPAGEDSSLGKTQLNRARFLPGAAQRGKVDAGQIFADRNTAALLARGEGGSPRPGRSAIGFRHKGGGYLRLTEEWV